jgi:hypothetical protein
VPLNFKNPVLRSGSDKSLVSGMPEFPRVDEEMVERVRLDCYATYPSSWIRVLCAQHSNHVHKCPSHFVMGWSLTDLNDATLTQIPFIIRPDRKDAVLEGGFWKIPGCQHALDGVGRETKTPPRGKCVAQ